MQYNQKKKANSAAFHPFWLGKFLTFQGTCAKQLHQRSLSDLWSLNPIDGRQRDSLQLRHCISSLLCPSAVRLCHYSFECCPYSIWQNLLNLIPERLVTLRHIYINSWRTRRVPAACHCSALLAWVFWWQKLPVLASPWQNLDFFPENSLSLKGQQYGYFSWINTLPLANQWLFCTRREEGGSQVSFHRRCYPSKGDVTLTAHL